MSMLDKPVKGGRYQLICIILISIIAIASLSGCIEFAKSVQDSMYYNTDPIIKRAEPYTDKIVFENVTMRAMAASIANGAPSSGDKEYKINKVYRYVVDNYAYYSDPRSREFIQSPFETIQIGGGDCEDLTILLCSLLENIGIKTYIVMTDTHMYCLAADVDIDKLKSYIETSLLEEYSREINQEEDVNTIVENGKLFIVNENQESFLLKNGYIYYYGGNGSKIGSPDEYMKMTYDITSDQPLTTYVVPSKADYESICNNKEFNRYPSYDGINVLKANNTIARMNVSGGLVLKNDCGRDAVITLKVKIYQHYPVSDILKNKTITNYIINNQTCVVLDPTAGKGGYPGYSWNSTNIETVAIDPVTKEYYNL